MDLIFPAIKWTNSIYLPGLWLEMSAVKDLQNEVMNEENLLVCHSVHHFWKDIVWRACWAAEVSDRLVYTDNCVNHKHKATVERLCRSTGHCCAVPLGQKDEVDGMRSREEPLSAAPACLGEGLTQGRAYNREAEVVLKNKSLSYLNTIVYTMKKVSIPDSLIKLQHNHHNTTTKHLSTHGCSQLMPLAEQRSFSCVSQGKGREQICAAPLMIRAPIKDCLSVLQLKQKSKGRTSLYLRFPSTMLGHQQIQE